MVHCCNSHQHICCILNELETKSMLFMGIATLLPSIISSTEWIQILCFSPCGFSKTTFFWPLCYSEQLPYFEVTWNFQCGWWWLAFRITSTLNGSTVAHSTSTDPNPPILLEHLEKAYWLSHTHIQSTLHGSCRIFTLQKKHLSEIRRTWTLLWNPICCCSRRDDAWAATAHQRCSKLSSRNCVCWK